MQLTVLGYYESPMVWNKLQAVFDEAKLLETDSTAWPEVAGVVADSWSRLTLMDDLSFILKGALIHVLATTKLEEYDQFLWERIQIARGADGEYLAPSVTWKLFCVQHLGSPHQTISNMKRNFEVFYHKVGFSLDEMLLAGRSKLKLARALMESNHPNRDPEIMEFLLGAPDKCSMCDSDQPSHPMVCSDCGERFGGVKPATYAELEALVGKKRLAPDAGVRVWLEGNVEYDDEELRVIVSVLRDDEVTHLPVWSVPILARDEVGEGIPFDWLDEVVILLGRKFR